MLKSPGEEHPQKVIGWAARDTSGVLSPFKFSRRANGDEDVTLKILYCGICHTDLHTVKNEWGISFYPVVPGHEIVGVVTEVGKKVTKFKVGDKAGIGCMVGSCLACPSCKEDSVNYCNKMITTYNAIYHDDTPTYGGYSDMIVVEEHFAVQFPDNLPLNAGAPLLCAGITVYSPLKYFGLSEPGMHLGVVGLGGLGHVTVKFAKAFGLKVTVISTSPSKEKEAVEQLGADSFLVSRDPKQMEHDHSDAVVGDVEVVSQESSASGDSMGEISLRCLELETERQGPVDSERPSGDVHQLTVGDIQASLPTQPQASRKNRRSGLNFVYEEEGDLIKLVAQASKPVSDKHWRFKRFSHAELVFATTNFSDDKKTGEGKFGSVFRGYLSNLDSAVAVKKISRGAIKELVRELHDINELLWHENLLELIGWSCRSGELLLVSEFMPNGSLHAHLFAKKSTLKWTIRYKIALELASVLLYLHEEREPHLVHGDVKSSNVMLDSGFNAKLGDFGMNRLIDNDEVGSQTTMIPMTDAYLAPEYISSRRASAESDVYSFGVVALEIASGRKAIETGENPTMGLVEKIWNLYENGRLGEAADERLRMDFDTKEMECLIIVGLWCAHPDYKLRPSMRQVIAVLQFEAEMPSLPNRMPVAMSMPSSSSAHSSQHSITTSSFP